MLYCINKTVIYNFLLERVYRASTLGRIVDAATAIAKKTTLSPVKLIMLVSLPGWPSFSASPIAALPIDTTKTANPAVACMGATFLLNGADAFGNAKTRILTNHC